MMRNKDYLAELERSKLATAAYELGLEVGEQGHEDSAGWVGAELKHILQQAEELNLMDLVRRRYEFGKEKGRMRREAKARQDRPSNVMKAQSTKEDPAVSEIPDEARTSNSTARVSSEEGIWSTISIMRFARGDEEMQSHLSNMFATVADLHDKVMRMERGATPEATFDDALRVITAEGWLSDYEVKFFDHRSAMASVDTTSMLARSFGRCDAPMCLPILGVMETIGFKTFERPVLAIEEHCMAQGHDHCRFKVFPRYVGSH
jgi:hypothetical protein